MAQYKADIKIMPLKVIQDPQGSTTTDLLHRLAYHHISEVRVGKHITMLIEAETKADAMEHINDICNNVLINPLVEGYDYQIKDHS